MVDTGEPLSIESTLEIILDYTASVDPELRDSLREGISFQQIEEKTREFSVQLSEEVRDLYAWHDGMKLENRELNRLFYYHYFLPLDEALELYRAFNDSEYPLGNGLLPLFEFEGEYYATLCSSETGKSAPIYFVYHDEMIVYNSLATMLSSILECYETGAYIARISSEGEPVENHELVSQIKLKWNPIRGELYSHP